mmetsp:Transcript_31262/g.61949  ORF Transcript_31262/g.61949 Transcript_31262/m.61949 type:complete len:224 (+) Transcript_31262:835-1506(+)
MGGGDSQGEGGDGRVRIHKVHVQHPPRHQPPPVHGPAPDPLLPLLHPRRDEVVLPPFHAPAPGGALLHRGHAGGEGRRGRPGQGDRGVPQGPEGAAAAGGRGGHQAGKADPRVQRPRRPRHGHGVHVQRPRRPPHAEPGEGARPHRLFLRQDHERGVDQRDPRRVLPPRVRRPRGPLLQAQQEARRLLLPRVRRLRGLPGRQRRRGEQRSGVGGGDYGRGGGA